MGVNWLGCELWQQLGLSEFWEERLGGGRKEVPWTQVLKLLVVSRRVAPGSEFRLHRQEFDQSAMG
ncbi:MAG: IS1634 family transposase, partial [Terriglobia bacterium]